MKAIVVTDQAARTAGMLAGVSSASWWSLQQDR
jgi:hypothetical protein